MIDILALPGTGFPHGGDGITEAHLAGYDKANFATRIIPYPATYGGAALPYANSKIAGRAALLKAAQLAKNPVVLSGYSQGAVIAGDLAWEIEKGEHPELTNKVLSVALIADGRRPIGGGGTSKPIAPHYGIVDQRPIRPTYFPIYWAAVHDDPITAIPAGSPLRTVADLSEWYSINSPADVILWGAKALDRAIKGRLQDWWRLDKIGQWNGAIAQAQNFLFRGRHTRAYIDEGHLHALTRSVMTAT